MQQPNFASQITQTYNVYVNPYGMRRLSPTFRPGSFDVLCARGKLAYDHEGNDRFRALVRQHQKQYSAAKTKYEKSKIVSFIVSAVRNASPQGGFVKNIDGLWHEVGDRHAKEKVGQTFRDLLHTKYSSSTKAKARARVEKRTKGDHDDMDEEEDEQKQQPPQKKRAVKFSSRADDVQSSVSVVSEDSMQADEVDNTTNNHQIMDMPPLKSVVVKKQKQKNMRQTQPKQYQQSQVVSPARSQRMAPSNLMDTLRSSINTFDGRESTNSQQPPYPPEQILNHPGGQHTDLEPLPLGQAPAVKVDFNQSSSSMQSEQSFEDVMSEFCQNMSVPV